jgi:dTDP-4-dehydrorhamnose 3,5-epimerase
MLSTSCELSGLQIIHPQVFGDQRGWFFESWNERRYHEAGMDYRFVQDNFSFSRKGTLRGLHFQNPSAQGKLVSVLQGEVFDVAVDIRLGSPTFARWRGVTLSDQNRLQFFLPPGFAHGFVVLSDTALFHYKCTGFYSPQHDRTLRWNDPDLAIQWPVQDPILSPKDAQAPLLRDVLKAHLFAWQDSTRKPTTDAP